MPAPWMHNKMDKSMSTGATYGDHVSKEKDVNDGRRK